MLLPPSLRRSAGRRQAVEKQRIERSLKERILVEVKEDDLELFKQIKSRTRENFLIQSPDDFDSTFSEKLNKLRDAKQIGHSSEILNVGALKNDYDWLLTPPDTPLFPSLDDKPSKPSVRTNDVHCNHPKPLSRLAPIEMRNSTSPSRLPTTSQRAHGTPPRRPSPLIKASPSKSISSSPLRKASPSKSISSSPNSKKSPGSNSHPTSPSRPYRASSTTKASSSNTPTRGFSPARSFTPPKVRRNAQEHSASSKLIPKRSEFIQNSVKAHPPTIAPNRSLDSALQTMGHKKSSLNKDIARRASSSQLLLSSQKPSLAPSLDKTPHKSETQITKGSPNSGKLIFLPFDKLSDASEDFPLLCNESSSDFWVEETNLSLICNRLEDPIMRRQSNDARINRCGNKVMDSRKLEGQNCILDFRSSDPKNSSLNSLQDKQVSSSILKSFGTATTASDVASSSRLLKNQFSFKLSSEANEESLGLSKKTSRREEIFSFDQIMAIVSASEDNCYANVPSSSRNSVNRIPSKGKTEPSAITGLGIADDLLKSSLSDGLQSGSMLFSRYLVDEIIHQAAQIALEKEGKVHADNSVIGTPQIEPKCNCIIM